jgi:ribosomal protein L11 methylase PrmA
VANLTAPLLERVAGQIDRLPAVLVCSGLLVGEAERVSAALSAAGLQPAGRRTDGDWAALLCRGPESDGAAG